MRILALNPYHGGSHQAFLDGWIAYSRHEFEVLSLPAYKWKWRMRHASATFAVELANRDHETRSWDALFSTDMLNLAEFRGLCHNAIHRLPTVVYFHENQLTYPNREPRDRDLHFAFTNITTCLAASEVWFNSAFHRDTFVDAVRIWMRRMPDYQLLDAADQIQTKSSIHMPGIDMPLAREQGRDMGPLRILWVSRWEHDKDPDTYFQSLHLLQQQGVDFRLAVLGQSYGDVPDCFAAARESLAQHIDHWGYATSQEQYMAKLREAHVVVSTALHEFFGIAILEAVGSGCFPLVPNQLAYPEVLGHHEDFFHDGTAVGIARRLGELNNRVQAASSCWQNEQTGVKIASAYAWEHAAIRMDAAIESCCLDA